MDLIEQNKQSYNKIAELFSSTRGYVWGDISFLAKNIKDGDNILDLGCGNGRLVESLQVKGESISYLGIDNSEGLIKQAQKSYPDQKFEVCDVLDIGDCELGIEKFDVIFMVSSLNHFPKDNQQSVIENVKRLLKPGGKLLMVNWNLWNRDNLKSIWKNVSLAMILFGERGVTTHWKTTGVDVPLYYYAFTKGRIKRLLQKNGFTVTKNYYSAKNDPDRPGKKSSWLRGLNIVTVAKLK
ncbi:class I SAM-dependent methyltransferase [Candidatus Falkowbacteria bacterium]|nr:class I SAM-dependent methyltransferase [Candidatus Falkowbacteria bacterium]